MPESFIPRSLRSARSTVNQNEVDTVPDGLEDYEPVGEAATKPKYFSPYAATETSDAAPFKAKPFSEWVAENGRAGGETKDYTDFANYLRTSAIRQGAYTIGLEQDLRNNTVSALRSNGMFPDIDPAANPDEFNAAAADLFKVPALDEDRRLSIALAGLATAGQEDSVKEARDILSQYSAAKPAFARIGEEADEQYVAEFRALEAKALALLEPGSKPFEAAKKSLSRSASDSFTGAVVEFPILSDEGPQQNPQFTFDINAEAVKKIGFDEAVARGVEQGLISPDNVPEVMAMNQPVDGTDIPMWQLFATQKASEALNNLSTMENARVPESDPVKNALKRAWRSTFALTAFSDALETGKAILSGENVQDTADKGWMPKWLSGTPRDPKANYRGALWWKTLNEDTEKPMVLLVNKYAEHLADIENGGTGNLEAFSPENEGRVLTEIQRAMEEAGEEVPSTEDLALVLRKNAVQRGLELGLYDFEDTPEEAFRNIRIVEGSPTPIVHPALYERQDLFEAAVAAHPTLTPQQKASLETQRLAHLEAAFEYRDKMFSRDSNHAAKWNEHKIRRMHEGASRHEILAEYQADPNNFSESKDRLEGIGASVLNGVTETFAAIPAMMGMEFAQKHLINNAKERVQRNEIRQAFGVETDFWHEAAETVAPMLIDVVATAALTPITGGGSLAVFSAKNAAKLTAQGFIKGVVGGALRSTAGEAVEVTAKKAMLKGLVKNTLDEKGTIAMLNEYNATVGSQFKIAAAQFLPAANRSAASTYGTTYSSLENSNYTHEQKHDIAKGAALIAGTTTGVITGAFGFLGRGGAEDALLSGATRGQMKTLFARLSNTSDITDSAFNAVVAKQLRKSLKVHALTGTGLIGKYAKGAFDEGAEEFLDEMINSALVQATYLGEDVPLMDALQQGMHAFLLGGMFGSALPAGADALGGVRTHLEHRYQTTGESGPATPTPKARDAMRAAEDNFIRGVTADLEKTGNPVTAKVMAQLLREGMRTRTVGGLNRNQVIKALRAEDAPAPVSGTPNPDSLTPAPEAPAPAPEPGSAPVVVETGIGSQEQVDPELEAAYAEAMSLIDSEFSGRDTDVDTASDWSAVDDWHSLGTKDSVPAITVPIDSLFLNPHKNWNQSKSKATRDVLTQSAAGEGTAGVRVTGIRRDKASGELVASVELDPERYSEAELAPAHRKFSIPLAALPKNGVVIITNAVQEVRALEKGVLEAAPEKKAKESTRVAKKNTPKKVPAKKAAVAGAVPTPAPEPAAKATTKKAAKTKQGTTPSPKVAALKAAAETPTPVAKVGPEEAGVGNGVGVGVGGGGGVESPAPTVEVETPKAPAKKPAKKTTMKAEVLKDVAPSVEVEAPTPAAEAAAEVATAGTPETSFEVDAAGTYFAENAVFLSIKAGGTTHRFKILPTGEIEPATVVTSAWSDKGDPTFDAVLKFMGDTLAPVNTLDEALKAFLATAPAEVAPELEPVPDTVSLTDNSPDMEAIVEILGAEEEAEPFQNAPDNTHWVEEVALSTGDAEKLALIEGNRELALLEDMATMAARALNVAIVDHNTAPPAGRGILREIVDLKAKEHAAAVDALEKKLAKVKKAAEKLESLKGELQTAELGNQLQRKVTASRKVTKKRGDFTPWTGESLAAALGEDFVNHTNKKRRGKEYKDLYGEADPFETMADTLNELALIGYPVSFNNNAGRFGLPKGGVIPTGGMERLSLLLHQSIEAAYPTRVFVLDPRYEAVQALGEANRGKKSPLKTQAYATPKLSKDYKPGEVDSKKKQSSDAVEKFEAFEAAQGYETKRDTWAAFVEAMSGYKGSVNPRFTAYITTGSAEKNEFDKEAARLGKSIREARDAFERTLPELQAKVDEVAARARSAGRVGIFDNNPINVSVLLARRIPVFVPRDQQIGKNPAIITNTQGWVVRVQYPEYSAATGIVMRDGKDVFEQKASKSRDKVLSKLYGDKKHPDPKEAEFLYSPALRFVSLFHAPEGSPSVFADSVGNFDIPRSYGVDGRFTESSTAEEVSKERETLRKGGKVSSSSLFRETETTTVEHIASKSLPLFKVAGNEKPKIDKFLPPSLTPRGTADTIGVEQARKNTQDHLQEAAILAAMKVSVDQYLNRIKTLQENTGVAPEPEKRLAGLRYAVLKFHPQLQGIKNPAENDAAIERAEDASRVTLAEFAEVLQKRHGKGKEGKLAGTTPEAVIDSFIERIVIPFEVGPNLNPKTVAARVGARVFEKRTRHGDTRLAAIMSTMPMVEDPEGGETQTQAMSDIYEGSDLRTGLPSVNLDPDESAIVDRLMERLGELSASDRTEAEKRQIASQWWADISSGVVLGQSALDEVYAKGFRSFVSPDISELAAHLNDLSIALTAFADRETADGKKTALRQWLEDKYATGVSISAGSRIGTTEKARESVEDQPAMYLLTAIASSANSPGADPKWLASLKEVKLADVIYAGLPQTAPTEFGSLANAFGESGPLTKEVFSEPASIHAFMSVLIDGSVSDSMRLARQLIDISPSTRAFVASMSDDKAATAVEIVAKSIRDAAADSLGVYHRDKVGSGREVGEAKKLAVRISHKVSVREARLAAISMPDTPLSGGTRAGQVFSQSAGFGEVVKKYLDNKPPGATNGPVLEALEALNSAASASAKVWSKTARELDVQIKNILGKERAAATRDLNSAKAVLAAHTATLARLEEIVGAFKEFDALVLEASANEATLLAIEEEIAKPAKGRAVGERASVLKEKRAALEAAHAELLKKTAAKRAEMEPLYAYSEKLQKLQRAQRVLTSASAEVTSARQAQAQTAPKKGSKPSKAYIEATKKLEDAQGAQARAERASADLSRKLDAAFKVINPQPANAKTATKVLQNTKARAQKMESGVLNAPSYFNTTVEQAEENRRRNQEEIDFLGLQNGDPESVLRAFEQIVASPDIYPTSMRVIASLLLQNPALIRNTTFNIFPMQPLVSVAGRFSRHGGKGQVVVNPNGSNGLGLASVLLHEYTHALTSDAISNPNRSPLQQAAVTRIEAILKLARIAAGNRETGTSSLVLMDGLLNVDEFVTHLFSSLDFQRELKMLTAPGSPRNFFARVWEAILRMVGIEPSNPAYDAAIDAVFDLASASVPTEPLTMNSIVRRIAEGTHAQLSDLSKQLQERHRMRMPASAAQMQGDNPGALENTLALLDMLRGKVPTETAVLPSLEYGHTMWEENGIVYFNPTALTALLADVPVDQRGNLLDRILTEERIHVAARRALSEVDMAAYAAALSDADYKEEALIYGNDSDDATTGQAAILSDLASEDPAVVQTRKEMLAAERIRRQVQQVLYGESTEDVVAFYRTNDVARKKFIRGLKRKAFELTESKRLAQFDPKIRAMLSRVITEVRAANLNYRPMAEADSVFSPAMPHRTTQILAAQAGGIPYTLTAEDLKDWQDWKPGSDPSEIPVDMAHMMRDFRPVFALLEAPVAYSGEYDSPEGWRKLLKGEFDPRAKALADNQAAFMRMISVTLQGYQQDLTRYVDKAVAAGADRSELTTLIADSSGSTRNVLPDDVALAIDKDLDAMLLRIAAGEFVDADFVEAQVSAHIEGDEFYNSLPEDSKRLQRRMLSLQAKFEAESKAESRNNAYAARDAKIAQLESQYRISAKRHRDQALSKLSAYPDILQRIVQLRQMLDGFSLEAKKVFNNSEQTNAHFDNQLGIYITRTYRMFHDPDYITELTDPTHKKFADHEAVRQEASKFLLETWRIEQIGKMSDENPELSLAEIEQLVEKKLTTMPTGGTTSYGQFLMMEFLENYEHPVNDPMTLATSESFKLIAGNLKKRKNIPPALQNLLGVYDSENGETLLVRAISNVASLVSNQNMLEQTKKLGQDNNWLLTEQQYKDLRETDIVAAERFAPIRLVNGGKSKHNPFIGMYGPADHVEALAKLGSKAQLKLAENASEHVITKSLEMVGKLTGKVMAIKTLGSVGHFARNMMSMPFFAISQGYFAPGMYKDMAKTLLSESRQTIGRGAQEALLSTFPSVLSYDMDVDIDRAELVGLGILNDSVNANVLKDMLSGVLNSKSLEENHQNLMMSAATATGEKLKDIGRGLVRLEETMDAFYKIPYYKHTLAMLTEAREAGSGQINGVDIATMSDYDLKRVAADKVLRTAPSYSRTLPIVKAFSKSSWSNVVAPFVRWKTEMFRTTINTFKMANEEMKSGNPVLLNRGIMRLVGMMSIQGASVALPAAAAYFLAGLDAEDDEALRKTMPDFSQNNSIFYFRVGGELKSIDLTFVNPFSFSTDGISRALGELLVGDYGEAATKLVTVTFLEPFLDEQILLSAALSVKNNRDPVSGLPIWNPDGLDTWGEATGKKLNFIMRNAASPRVLLDLYDAQYAFRSPSTIEDYSPTNLILRGVAPFRVRDVDLNASYNRFLYEAQKKRQSLAQEKSVLASRKPMTDEDVRRNYRESFNKTVRLAEELRSVTLAFESMGIKGGDLFKAQKDAGMGERNMQLLRYGMVERPVPSPVFRERMVRDPWGIARLQVYDDEIRKHDRITRLE